MFHNEKNPKNFKKKAKVSHQRAFAPSVCHSHNLTAISRKYIGSIYDLIQTTKQFNQNTDWIALLPEKQTRQKNTLPGLNQLVVEEQNLIQLVCCVAVHLFSHMRVDVQCGTDIAMTESALDRLDVHAMLNHHGR